MGGRRLSDTRPHTLGFCSTEQLSLDGRYISSWCGAAAARTLNSRAELPASKGDCDKQAKVHEGVDTIPISAAEKVSLGFHLFPPKAPKRPGRGLCVALRSEEGGLKPK